MKKYIIYIFHIAQKIYIDGFTHPAQPAVYVANPAVIATDKAGITELWRLGC